MKHLKWLVPAIILCGGLLYAQSYKTDSLTTATGSGSVPTPGVGVKSALTFGESSGTTPTCQAGLDIIWSSYSASGLQICNNGGSLAPIASLPISLTTQVSGTLQAANGAPLVGTSGSLGGSALTAGNCSTTTVAITGALNTMAVVVTPKASPGNNYYWKGVVTSSGTVTVYICAVTAGTPTAETYSVRVIQ